MTTTKLRSGSQAPAPSHEYHTKPAETTATTHNRSVAFFSKLPQEVRDAIYTAVLTPAPRVLFQDHQPRPDRRRYCRGIHLMQPNYPLGRNIRSPLHVIKWRRCLIGTLLVCKSFTREMLDHLQLYARTVFHFASPSLTSTFLEIVPKASLENVKCIIIEFIEKKWPFQQDAYRQFITGVRDMWNGIATGLPNVEHLSLELDLDWDAEGIVPDFDDDRKFRAEHFEGLRWVQDVQIFSQMANLKDVNIRFKGDKNFDATIWAIWISLGWGVADFAPFATLEEANLVVTARWAEWFKALHKSMAEAVSKFILKKEAPWSEHLELLERYYRWREQPLELTGLYSNDEEVDVERNLEVMTGKEKRKERCKRKRREMKRQQGKKVMFNGSKVYV